MKFQHVYHAVHCEPWLILPSAHAVIAQLVESRLGMTAAEWKAERPSQDMFGDPLPTMKVDSSGIAEIPIFGTIGKGLGLVEKSCGATCVDDVQSDLAQALDRYDVRGVLLNINSPGGTITGLPECAAAIRRLSDSKPVVAYTDTLMASAAYWLGSQADMIVASQSAKLGSIGVFFPWVDRSKQAAAMGLKVEAITNTEGIYKGTRASAASRSPRVASPNLARARSPASRSSRTRSSRATSTRTRSRRRSTALARIVGVNPRSSRSPSAVASAVPS